MSLATLERLLADSTPISAPAQRRALASALTSLKVGPILERVAPQAPGAYAGWPVAIWPTAQLSVFALGPRTSIPLHDHPGMHVLTRTLVGRASVTAYDWIDVEGLVAGRKVETTLAPTVPVWLTEPRRSNLHALETQEACVFVDLFAPYYDEPAGRGCSYYAVESSQADRVLLKRVPPTGEA